MVYTKPDGTTGFSWKRHYEFLVKEHPENLEEIVQARLEALAFDEPEAAGYYQDLSSQLRKKLDQAVQDNPEFGYTDSDAITKEFVKTQNLTHFFDEVPALSDDIDAPSPSLSVLEEELDLSFLENLEGIDFIDLWK